MKTKYIQAALFLFFGLFSSMAQDSKTFNSPQSEGGKVEACESITLSPGFSFKATADQSMSFSINRSVCSPRQELLSVSNDKNYILKITPLDGTSHVEVANGKLSIDRDSRALVQIQYFDGLGRPVQTVQRGITPSKQDLVSIQTYDAFGRDSEQWLPAPCPGSGSYLTQSAVMTAAVSFYGDQNPFSKPVYESSPLGRVNEQYGPGEAWQDNGKSVKTTFLTNTSTGELSCSLYKVTGTSESPTLTRTGNYPENQLYITRLEDEDGNISYEFKDKLEQVVLTRQMNENLFHDTYYVYDASGNLTFVLPPNASDHLTSTGIARTADNEELKQYAYLYRYDGRKRCIQKRLPGTDWTYYVYDRADRLILSQDGEQRKKKEWSFNKYDALGRVILAGVYTDASTHASLCTQYQDTIVKESPQINNYGYSWNTPPIVTYDKVLTVNYYDDYEHLLNQKPYFRDNLNYVEKEGYGKRYTDPTCTSCASKGLLTGTRIKMLDGSGEIVTALYYDDKGRVVQKKSTNHMGGFDNEYYAYTFTGQPIRQHMEHSTAHSGFTETSRYGYDHAGRLINTRHQINNEPEVELSDLAYDALGRLNEKRISGELESISYNYNIRGWTKSIESANFIENLHYEAPSLPNATPCYNGNISQVNYQKPTQGTNDAFTYRYDRLNRLKNSIYYKDGYFHDGYGEYFEYDKHGNITILQRSGALSADPLSNGGYDLVDCLRLSYIGNQLTNVDELSDVVRHNFYGAPYFKKYSGELSLGDEYGYDSNGNMLYDFNKEVSWIQYNSLNLPGKLQTTQGNTLENTYDATGVKRRMVARTASGMYIPAGSGSIQDILPLQLVMEDIYNYSSNVVYRGSADQISKILLADGYMVPEDHGGWKYIFQLKDHLGSIQVELDGSGDIIGNMNYYASGMKMVRSDNWMESSYRFTGKEYQPMHELNWYDFLARTYDPPTMRFTTMDPLAEKYYSISPYVYCMNNPVNYIDPDGMSTHTDSLGHIVAIYNDGDMGVYSHSISSDTYDGSTLSADGGARMGETYFWDEFINPESGDIFGTIQFGKSFDPIIDEKAKLADGMNLKEIASKSAGGGEFDIKAKYQNVGGLLKGKYVSSRSAGNFLAGYNASKGTIMGVGISFETFQKLAGALHIEENKQRQLSTVQKIDIVHFGTYSGVDKNKFVSPMWGEIPYQYRMSKMGWNYGKKK